MGVPYRVQFQIRQVTVSKDIKKTTSRWARLSVGYYRDPKVIACGPIAELAFIRLLALAREVVESADKDGAVPYLLAARELREVTDLYAAQVERGTIDDLLEELETCGLIKREDTDIIVVGYEAWQTTKNEIEEFREANRKRVAQYRARKNKESEETEDTEENMALYENGVEPFEDLRESGNVKAGKTRVGKHGLPPQMVADAEKIVEHLTATRSKVLGGNFRVTNTWWSDTKKLLAGSGDNGGYTVGQVCDLIDFALTNRFWHAHCQTPAGLAKHANKLYASDEFIKWSLDNKRPADNRPRNELIGKDTSVAKTRGKLVADSSVNWSEVGDKL